MPEYFAGLISDVPAVERPWDVILWEELSEDNKESAKYYFKEFINARKHLKPQIDAMVWNQCLKFTSKSPNIVWISLNLLSLARDSICHHLQWMTLPLSA